MKREWLNQLRKYKRMTQQQIAINSYIDRSYYSQIENGKRNPSLNVAINIAKVLDIDPLLFFHDDHTLEDSVLNEEIYEYFRKIDSGQVLYLYSDDESYSQHVMTFFLIGVKKKRHCFMIAHEEEFLQLKQSLETILTDEEMNAYIHFIPIGTFKNLATEGLLTRFEKNAPVSVWIHEHQDQPDDWVCTLQSKVNHKKVFIVYSYNAAIVTAGTHIKMMRKFPFLMTDLEIVDSPLYHSSKRTGILPSFSIQENM